MGGEPAPLGAPRVQSGFEGWSLLWQGCKSAMPFAYIAPILRSQTPHEPRHSSSVLFSNRGQTIRLQQPSVLGTATFLLSVGETDGS